MDTISLAEERLKSLVVFRKLLKNTTLEKLLLLLEKRTAERYAEFVSSLYETTDNLSRFILELVLESDNLYVRTLGQGNSISPLIEQSVKSELETLTLAASLTSAELKSAIGSPLYLPDWQTEEADIKDIYLSRMKEIGKHGYGIFAKYRSFIIENGEVLPIKTPDSTHVEQLAEYQRERNKVIENTRALVQGLPASNVLLYGDAGTGKSSTVKAAAHRFAAEGLRLIEVKKHQLLSIPALMDRLAKNPLKFILFIDDLSFNSNDDNFAALKAVLEGSVSAKSGNIAIYATSNRRHLLKESFSDREGNDMHLADTIEESISLSERFGLTITFSRPDKEKYRAILSALAIQYNVKLEDEQDYIKAEAFAMNHGGRSPRAAKQFIEQMKSATVS